MIETLFYGFIVFFQLLLIALVWFLVRRSHQMRLQRDALLQEKDVVFNFVHDVGDVFGDAESVDLNALLKRVLFYALRTTKAGAGAIYLLEEESGGLRAHATSGVFPPMGNTHERELDQAFSKIRLAEKLVRAESIPVGSGLVGTVARDGHPILVADAERDARVPHFSADFFQIHSMLLVPMRFHNAVLGVLVVINRVDSQRFIEADQNLLQALADQASVSIHYARLSAALDEKRRLDYDLTIARRIQTALLPKSLPRLPGVNIHAFSEPAQQIGGDYYDFVRVDDDHLGIAIADVSGKGVAAAIVMSVCRSLLQLEATGCLSPAAVLRTMNASLSRDLAEDMFVSMLYMILNVKTLELAIARAGHLAPIVTPADNGQPRLIESRGMALGIGGPDIFDTAIEETRITLHRGDMVVAYTDGVTEAMDQSQNEWGVLNLVKTVQIAAIDGAAAADVSASVQQKLLGFIGDTPQYDDMTLVVMRLT